MVARRRADQTCRMAVRPPWGTAGFAGRSAELVALGEVLDGAIAGSPGGAVVLGEAGVGKTRLVIEACRIAAGPRLDVLWGRCLRLQTWTMPYLPLVVALEGWLEVASQPERAALVDAAPALAGAVPSLGTRHGPAGPGGVPAAMVQALDHLAARRPTVLVVDDLQWVDAASLDVLAYAVAGLRSQRLGIVLTCRTDQLGDGNQLHGWLAEVRRSPLVREIALARLSLDETAEMLSLLLHRAPGDRLVDTVFELSRGNAYFIELLAADVDPATGQLRSELPPGLRGALLATWHRLSDPAREVTRLLAVASRPLTGEVLAAAAVSVLSARADVVTALREAAAAGVVVTSGARVWFRHPLLAEVLLETLPPVERVAAHEVLLEALQRVLPEPRLADLARHHEGAAHFEEAFVTSLRAADAAAAVEAFSEEADLRMRALRLWDSVSPAARVALGSEARLCADVAVSLLRAGDSPRALAVLDRGLAVLEDEPDPLQRSRVLRMWAEVGSTEVARPTDELARTLLRATDLTIADPHSPERAMVLVARTHLELGRGRIEEARALAEDAVVVAGQSGDARALCDALLARAGCSPDPATAEGDVLRAEVVAAAGHAAELRVECAQARMALLDDVGRLVETVAAGYAGHALASRHGLVHLAQLVGAQTVIDLCHLGRLGDGQELLRRLLMGGRSGRGVVAVRDAALRLALRLGALDEADAQVRQLDELAPHGIPLVGNHLLPTRCEYLLARDRAADALELLRRHAPGTGRARLPRGRELLVWAARSAAAFAEADAEQARGRLAGISGALGPELPRAPVHAVDAAWLALFEAETAAVDGPADPDLWRRAVEAVEVAGLRFEECRSRGRLAAALLRTGERPEATVELRTSCRMATEMGAEALGAQARGLARAARISLRPPAVRGRAEELLTRREREVLAHLVSGHTYAEIARELFISEKTVSVHVSNLLHKTGTANRAEAASWGRRAGVEE